MRLYADQPIGTVPRARELRRSASEVERHPLRALRETLPDFKWRHQAPIGSFYVDILCFSQALAIEVDGDTHTGNETYDAGRTAIIADEGFRVIRFTKDDVMRNLEGVLSSIAAVLTETEKGGAA